METSGSATPSGWLIYSLLHVLLPARPVPRPQTPVASHTAQQCPGTLPAHSDLSHWAHLSHPLLSTAMADRGKWNKEKQEGWWDIGEKHRLS